MHAVQTGIAAKMLYDESEITPKHLRVGINSSMVNNSALVKILFKKGIITEHEYWQSMVNEAYDEVIRYEKILSEHFNKKITLA